MGVQDLGYLVRCHGLSRFGFALAGGGLGYIVGGTMKLTGGKRVVATIGGAGAGWFVHWLLSRTCPDQGTGGDGGDGGDWQMLPESVPPSDGTEQHLFGPASFEPAISVLRRGGEHARDVTPVPRKPAPAARVTRPPVASKMTTPMVTTTQQALTRSSSIRPPATMPATMPSPSAPQRGLLAGNFRKAYGN